MNKDELAKLEARLSSPAFGGKAMGIDRLHGFLCAVVSAPDMIAPTDWMDAVAGGEHEYGSINEAEEFVALLSAFYNDVSRNLQRRSLELVLRYDLPEDARYQSWCEGYIAGWSLSTEEWLTPGNEALKHLTLPILLLSGAFREEAERKGEEFAEDEDYLQAKQECMRILPAAVTGIYEFWLERRKTGARQNAPAKREARKVGRNELCPCGSGKKFKHCCGNAKTLH